jgi:hypothetical protein
MIFDFTNPLKQSIGGRWSFIEFVLIASALFLLLMFIPVWTVPGNDFFFQLSIIEPWILALFITLSVANALLIQMQRYIHRIIKEKKAKAGHLVKGATAISILLSSLSAAIVCAACYSTVLAFLGLGVSSFLVEQRELISLIALGLTLIALYYTGKRINHNCTVCKI